MNAEQQRINPIICIDRRAKFTRDDAARIGVAKPLMRTFKWCVSNAVCVACRRTIAILGERVCLYCLIANDFDLNDVHFAACCEFCASTGDRDNIVDGVCRRCRKQQASAD